jgi:putative hemolysin
MHAATHSVLARAVGLTPIGRAYARAAAGDPAVDFSARALAVLGIDVVVPHDALAEVPRSGPVIVVANHPSGALDGLALLTLIRRVRSDVRLMGNRWLRWLPELRECLVPVDVFGAPANAVRRNGTALRSAIQWLSGGGCLGIFPSGEVAHRDLPDGRVIESPWHHTAAELALRTDATVVPMFIAGRNSRLFRVAGRLHPLLRTALLPHELWAKRGSTVSVNVGPSIMPDELSSRADAATRTAFLRSRVEHLATAPAEIHSVGPVLADRPVLLDTVGPVLLDRPDPSGPPQPTPCSVAPRGLATAIDANVAAIESSLLMESGAFQVYCASASDLPAILPEIGRLRELTFRGVGEGTGLARDLDRFDQQYQHLFVWDRDHREIAGAYRVGATDVLGVENLYTRTLFDYDEALLRQIGPALELGRSFVQPDYQRDFSPLLLLWKGISRLVVRQPRYRRLFGVVSISDRYDTTSRQLLVKFLRHTRFDADLGRLVRAMNPPAPPRSEWVDAVTVERLEDVCALVRQIEPDGKDIPVLLRQYLKRNAKLLGFTVDPSFGNVLDGLVLVDLDDVEPNILARYMGKSHLRVFRKCPVP